MEKKKTAMKTESRIRPWPFEFTTVWPPVLLKHPYALTAYKIIQPEGFGGSSTRSSAAETILCFVSDGRAESRHIARAEYDIACQGHSGGTEEVEFRRASFDPSSCKLGESAADGLVKVLAKDANSYMSQCERVPFNASVDESGLYKVRRHVRHALTEGMLSDKDTTFWVRTFMNELCALLEIYDEIKDESEDKSESGDERKSPQAALDKACARQGAQAMRKSKI